MNRHIVEDVDVQEIPEGFIAKKAPRKRAVPKIPPYEHKAGEWWSLEDMLNNCSARQLSGVCHIPAKRLKEMTDAFFTEEYGNEVLDFGDFNGKGGIIVWTGSPDVQGSTITNLMNAGFEKILEFNSQHSHNRPLVMLVKKGPK
jgi:hypothetical protein